MENQNTTSAPDPPWIKWTARIISTVFILFFGIMALGPLLSNGRESAALSSDPQGWILTVYIIIVALGVITAWFREKPGGLILVISSLAMLIWLTASLGLKDIGVALLFACPFLISGILFLSCRKKS